MRTEVSIIQNHLPANEIETNNFKTVFLKGVGDQLNLTVAQHKFVLLNFEEVIAEIIKISMLS